MEEAVVRAKLPALKALQQPGALTSYSYLQFAPNVVLFQQLEAVVRWHELGQPAKANHPSQVEAAGVIRNFFAPKEELAAHPHP
jgi:hypothetical protein